jgi:hypothetical protein
MNNELGMRNEELGIPDRLPCGNFVSFSGGWAAILIPHSYFLISMLRSGRKT